MDLNGGIIINKYGAVEVSTIVEMQKEINATQSEISNIKYRCLCLEKVIATMAGVESRREAMNFVEASIFESRKRLKIDKMVHDIQKMVELTHADDYEYQTTPSVTKLIKIKKEKEIK